MDPSLPTSSHHRPEVEILFAVASVMLFHVIFGTRKRHHTKVSCSDSVCVVTGVIIGDVCALIAEPSNGLAQVQQ